MAAPDATTDRAGAIEPRLVLCAGSTNFGTPQLHFIYQILQMLSAGAGNGDGAVDGDCRLTQGTVLP